MPNIHVFVAVVVLFAWPIGAIGCRATPAPAGHPQRARVPQDFMWISPEEVKRLPMRGPAWKQLKAAADGDLGSPNIADQNSHHDVNTLAVALVYARTGDSHYRKKAAHAIWSAAGTERGGTSLALARNLLSYVIASELIDFKE